jgi:hypothetical protein
MAEKPNKAKLNPTASKTTQISQTQNTIERKKERTAAQKAMTCSSTT